MSPSFKVVACSTFGFLPPCNPISFVINHLIRDEAELVHAHSYIFLTSVQAGLVRKLKPRPLVLHLHGGLSAVSANDGIGSRFLHWMKTHAYDPTLGSFLLRSADVIMSVSKGDLDVARDVFGVDEDKLVWVPNAVDMNYFHPSDKTTNAIPRVAYIGRLEPWKGIGTFLRVADKFESSNGKASFVVAGAGSRAREVRDFAERHELLTYLGGLSRPQVRELLQSIDVLVVPSYIEGIPSIILEALASEVPVVASSAGGIPELIDNQINGFLYDPSDEKALFSLVWMLANDSRLRTEIGRKGREGLVGDYEWQSVLDRVLRVYRRVGA
jgi:glycosyltransferase involved in cell wall biosynthesis